MNDGQQCQSWISRSVVIFSVDLIGNLTENAHTCQKVDAEATLDAWLSNTTVIVLPSLLWRLIWLDKHLAETAVYDLLANTREVRIQYVLTFPISPFP